MLSGSLTHIIITIVTIITKMLSNLFQFIFSTWGSIALSVLIVILTLIYEWRKQKLPMGIKPLINYSTNVTTKTDNRKVRFKAERVPLDIDLILIGSGISTLTLGALLSRIGWKVLILEQHDVAGGCTHTFKEKGFTFDTGLHYVGYDEPILKILKFATGKNNQIEWHQMGNDPIVSNGTFDEFRIGDKEYRIRDGEDNLVNDLAERFPHERENIIRYLKFAKRFSKKSMYFALKVVKPAWLANFLDKFINREFYQYSTRSAYDVVSDFIHDEELKDVICALSIDGGPRSKIQSFFIHAGIVTHFLKGGYYPIGGPGVIAQKIIPTIEKAGGKVLVSALVDRIIIENGRAVGVEVKTGFRKDKSLVIRSRHGVVSGAGLHNTYKKLLPSPYDTGMDNVLNSVSSNLTYNLLYVGLDRAAADLGIGSHNIWAWDLNNEGKSFNEYIEEFEADPWNKPPAIFIASNSAKDPTWDETMGPNKCALIVGAWGTIDQYAETDTSGISRKRSADYIAAKAKFSERLIERLYEFYPETRGHVVYQELATPETFKYYLNAPFGEVYGIDSTVNRWKCYPNLRPEHPEINGLYLTGQDITSLGFCGALMSGVMTLNAILGYGELQNLIVGREFFKEYTILMDMIERED
jgi:all-trans-retinol 13,14-reductase